MLSKLRVATMCPEKSGPLSKLLYFNNNLSDMSEVLHMQTLKHINENLYIH